MRYVLLDKDGNEIGSKDLEGSRWIVKDGLFMNDDSISFEITRNGEGPFFAHLERNGKIQTQEPCSSIIADRLFSGWDTIVIDRMKFKVELLKHERGFGDP